MEISRIFAEYRDEIFAAFWVTIKLTAYSGLGALVLGTFLAAMRLSPVPMLRWLGSAYVTILRNTPLTLILLFCSFGLSQTLGVTLANPRSPTSIADSNFRLAVLGLAVYTKLADVRTFGQIQNLLIFAVALLLIAVYLLVWEIALRLIARSDD